MEPLQPSQNSVPAGYRILAGVVLLGGLVGLVSVFADGSWEGGQAPYPYVWRDVAIVHLLCALPLAWMLARFMYRRVPAIGSLLIAASLFVVSVLPFLSIAHRAAPALGLMTALLTTLFLIDGSRRPRDKRVPWPATIVAGGLGIVALLILPWTYVGARLRHDGGKLGEYLEQSRFGDARTLVQGMLVLDTARTWNDHPLTDVAADIDRVVGDLEARVSSPLAVEATDAERLERARLLAMLGRTRASLEVVQLLQGPDVDNLRGTIYETLGEYESALASFQRARTEWQSRRPTPERATELLRATTGVAFSQRKLGRYTEAEATYRQVLALAPTADSYFLLAQFYEDTQQAEKAREHARAAMLLDSARYRQDGEKLIDKLSVYQFGCLGVFSAEHRKSTPGR